MAGKYQAYSEYKDSGVEWLGEIPEHWQLKKLKYICNVITGTKNTEDAIDDGAYPFFVRSQTVERINSIGADCEAILTAGDGVGVGKVFHHYNGKFDFHQRVYMLTNFSEVMGRFVYYYLFSNFYKVALDGNAKSTVDSLRMPQFLNFEFSLPNMNTQSNIIRFLDHETAKIDGLIEKQRLLIKILKEKRQAVISHAVTKGLNPSAPMKHSGVEWLGDVPEHWKTMPIKVVAELNPKKSEVSSKLNQSCSFVPMEKLKTGVILVDEQKNISEVFDGYTYFKNGDILMAKVTPCFENRNIAIATDLINEIGFGSTEIFVLRANHRVKNLFLFYRLQEEVFMSKLTSTMFGAGGLKRVPSEELNNYKIAIPDINEQESISKYLDSLTTKIDDLLLKAQDATTLMQERRTALISAAVTGKIDVRDWQAPEQVIDNKEQAA